MAEDDLVSLVTSRICHDLVSPIGAIDNGVELMSAISGIAHSAEMGLIGESARAAGIKLRLFRIAFGTASGDAVSRGADLAEVFSASFSRGRTTFDWPDRPASLPRQDAKLAALLLLCAEGAIPFGGKMSLTSSGDGTIRIDVTAERLRWKDALWNALTGATAFADVQAGEVQFPLAALAARHRARAVTATHTEAGCTIAA